MPKIIAWLLKDNHTHSQNEEQWKCHCSACSGQITVEKKANQKEWHWPKHCCHCKASFAWQTANLVRS